MPRLILICLFCWLPMGATLAQTKKIDSLRTVLRKHPQVDTFRVNRLNELNAELQSSESLTDSLANQVLAMARRLNYPEGQASALLNLVGLKPINEDKARLALLQQALPLAEKSKKKRLLHDVLSWIGTVEELKNALPYRERALRVAQSSGQPLLMAKATSSMASFYDRSINYPLALHFSLQSLKFAQEAKSIREEVSALIALGNSYFRLADYEQALRYLQQASKKQGSLIASEKRRSNRSSVAMEGWQAYILMRLGGTYRKIGRYEKASEMFQQALGYASQAPNTVFMDFVKIQIQGLQVDTYGRQGNPKALAEGHRVLALAKKIGDKQAINYSATGLGRYFLGVDQADSAVYYGRQALDILDKSNLPSLRDANELLAQAYAQRKEYEKAYQYQAQFMAYRDSLNNEAVTRQAAVAQYSDQTSRQQDQIALLTKDKQLQTEMARRMALSQQTKAAQLRYELDRNQSQITLLNKDKQLQIETTRRRELLRQAEAARLQNQMEEQQAETRRQRLLLLSSLAVLALLVGLAVVLYRNNRNKQQANILLQAQRDRLNLALTELKSTQTQLIQKEKMASLGELTAGIAHEIQNPLNFVNNFSEVSAELVTELEEEHAKPNRDTELEAELLVDLKQNLQKINHHGGRASAIVKGMLEHSRTETGERRPTDLNALSDEYLKLAYHGLRAKEKDFNAELITVFSPDLGLIEVVPQEIGRVLLNLYNNAFYAVKEKQTMARSDYQPTVTVSSTQRNGLTEIRVNDNGTGMPESVKAKIFQPFFTTKPTGEGTGLGLSLSYDIVTKGHAGSLTVESQEGEGTTFLIQLPTATNM